MKQETKKSLATATGIAIDSFIAGAYVCVTTLTGIALAGEGIQIPASLTSGLLAGTTAALRQVMKKRKIRV